MPGNMGKRTRQYLGLLAAVVSYYVVHEGAHLIYACWIGVFERIRFLGLGIQIVTDAQRMTDTQLGVFCGVGAAATLLAAYVLIILTPKICKADSKVFKACMYYISIAMLLLDPLYLSVLCGFFGGGDMNGIKLLFPEIAVRIVSAVIGVIHGVVIWKYLLPSYTKSFQKDNIHGE